MPDRAESREPKAGDAEHTVKMRKVNLSVAESEVHVLLLEPASTVNTGTAGGERTRAVEWI